MAEYTNRRCSKCQINFPNWKEHRSCPGCGEDTWQIDEPYDDDWREQLDALTAVPTGSMEERYLPNVTDDGPVIEKATGRYFIAHELLLNAGYLNLEPFDHVRIRDRLYELQAHLWRNKPGVAPGAWWIVPVPELELGWPVLDENPPSGG